MVALKGLIEEAALSYGPGWSESGLSGSRPPR